MKKLFHKIIGLSPLTIYMFIAEIVRSRSGSCEWYKIGRGKLKGINFWINTKRSPYFLDMVNGTYDKFIYDLFDKIKPQGKIIWDIGAHIGFHSLGFAKVVGNNGKVVAFEPNKYNVQRLKKNLSENPNLAKRIIIIEKALGSQIGKAKFHMTNDIDSARSSGGYLSSNLPPLSKESYKGFKSVKVDIETIDNVLKHQPHLTPHIIKIDVEGAESDVIGGAEKLLKKENPLIIAEIHNITAMLDVATQLINKGYKIHEVNPNSSSSSRCFILASKNKTFLNKLLMSS